MTDRYQPLRDAIAAGPTKGKWRTGRFMPSETLMRSQVVATSADGEPYVILAGNQNFPEDAERNAQYAAAADPDTIAALLAERDHLAEECSEQARLLGIGGSREAKLLAERDALKGEVQRLRTEPFSDEGRHPMGAERRGNWIVVAVSVSALKCATEGHPELEWCSDEGEFAAPIIVDLDTFVDEFVSALNSEKEDGSTVITEAFDKAIINAIEGGAVGIEIEAEAAKIRAALADGENSDGL